MPRYIRTGGVKPIMPTQTEIELVPKVIGIISIHDKPKLVAMLKRSGSLVTSLSTHDELLDASFKAIQSSDRFRKDLASYVQNQVPDNNFGNFVGDDAKWNYYTKYDPKTGEGGSRVGNIFRSIFTQENVQALTGAGINAFATSLQNKANKTSNQQAINYEKAKADSAIAEAAKLEAQGKLGTTTTTKNKWVLPLAIGGGVILLGTIIYFVVKKK